MKRVWWWLRLYVVAGVLVGSVNPAMAFGGAFQFSFVADFLTGILLWPLRLGGCA